MAEPTFRLSVFGDEIADDLATQLRVARALNIGYLEVRGVWGKNVLAFGDAEANELAAMAAGEGIAISAIGSPVGKSPLAQAEAVEQENLRRIFALADLLGTHRVRVFSFYPPDTHTNAAYDQYVPAAAERLAHMAEMAGAAGMLLLLENEKEIVGDTLARCHRLLTTVNSPHLRFVWDPANFVQVNEAQSVTRGWPLLGDYVAHVHIKDARLGSDEVTTAGAGDGEVDLLLQHLRESGYDGFLALEPHLTIAGHSSGFSGEDGMSRAVAALRARMAQTGCAELRPSWSSAA